MTTARPKTTAHKYEIVDYLEIPIDLIEAHPRNPRPSFHTPDNDPRLLALAESIKTQGQHHPALVYEIMNVWTGEPDQPGQYRLLQGERRWRSCRLGDVPTLRCHVARTPTSEAEEWEWLGIEEAFKQDWQPFFVLRYAVELAGKLGLSVTHPEMSAKTGIESRHLATAEKVFSLEPEIQAMVAEYEEIRYEQELSGARRGTSRLGGHGVRTAEFPVGKAAVTWDIFLALRQFCTNMVSNLTDLELQRLIAVKATRHGATQKDLLQFASTIKQLGKEAPVGLLSEIHNLLHTNTRTVRDVNKAAGTTQAGKLDEFAKRSEKLRDLMVGMVRNSDQLGTDQVALQTVEAECLRLYRDASELEKAIANRRQDLR